MEAKEMEVHMRTTSPIVTGTSVLAIKYKYGVMMLADTLGSYGSLARFTDLDRLRKVNDFCVIGGAGEWSDFQFITKLLQELIIRDFEENDGHQLTANQITSYLSRVLYNRRSRVNPLWNILLVAGFHNNQGYLGSVDLYGSCFEDNFGATGYGSYMAMPILRKEWRQDLDEVAARNLLERCANILFYRDCRALNKYTLATVTAKGVNISKPFSLQTNWQLKAFVEPSTKISPDIDKQQVALGLAQ